MACIKKEISLEKNYQNVNGAMEKIKTFIIDAFDVIWVSIFAMIVCGVIGFVFLKGLGFVADFIINLFF